jgi:hypothetical protein
VYGSDDFKYRLNKIRQVLCSGDSVKIYAFVLMSKNAVKVLKLLCEHSKECPLTHSEFENLLIAVSDSKSEDQKLIFSLVKRYCCDCLEHVTLSDKESKERFFTAIFRILKLRSKYAPLLFSESNEVQDKISTLLSHALESYFETYFQNEQLQSEIVLALYEFSVEPDIFPGVQETTSKLVDKAIAILSKQVSNQNIQFAEWPMALLTKLLQKKNGGDKQFETLCQVKLIHHLERLGIDKSLSQSLHIPLLDCKKLVEQLAKSLINNYKKEAS